MNRAKSEVAEYAWNPVTGCLKECRYCYARLNAMRWSGDVRKNLNDSAVKKLPGGLYILTEPWDARNGRYLNTPTGFYPTLHTYRLGWPQKVKVGSTIMVCSDGDLFGPWVPDDWIKVVFAAAQAAPQHHYLFQTQYPERYEQLYAARLLPKEFWYGTTVTDKNSAVPWTAPGYHCFVAIEPLIGPIEPSKHIPLGMEWVIAGAETGRSVHKVVPKAEWFGEIFEAAQAASKPLLVLDSLKGIVEPEQLLKERPAAFLQKEPTPAQKQRLWGICLVCGAHRPLKEMYALLLRRKRGDNPERIASMCPECYERFKQEIDKRKG